MSNDPDTREQGVEFGSLSEELDAIDYPIEKSDLVESHGDHELELENERSTLRETIGPLGETTYQSSEEVKRSVLNMVGEEAVGRANYSDRGGRTEQELERDEESV